MPNDSFSYLTVLDFRYLTIIDENFFEMTEII